MLRAGLIRRLAGGLYTFLPLGLRALRKVEQIVREEMDRAGALEVLMPALQPRKIWDRSGRYDDMGDVMFKVSDRQNREMVLGPTHEEAVTELVSREIRSYRDLPKTLYQIQTKFRDEIRPRFGLMRAKEFVMKDAYSFDLGWDEADASYQAMYEAYARIFERCGLETRVVEADTGAMGGKWSHEFMVLADSGENGLVECDSCSYAANLERAERACPAKDKKQEAKNADPESPGRTDEQKAPREIATPGMRTIEQVSEFLKCKPGQLVKTLIYVVNGNPVAVVVAGDRELNEQKLARALDTAKIALADDATIERVTRSPVGFAGPVGLDIPVYADIGLEGAANVVAGANTADAHLTGVNLSSDADVTAYYDLAVVRNEDSCPRCDGILREKRGIEVGHVFKLGTKYSKSFGASYLDDKGQETPIVMGCYGIGVTRTLQAIVEQSHDENGIMWPLPVAPYRVILLVLAVNDKRSAQAADALCSGLEQKGIDVLLDNRDERPGVKFKDADLLGFPVRVVVSKRSLAEDSVETKLRTHTEATLIPIQEAADKIAELCAC